MRSLVDPYALPLPSHLWRAGLASCNVSVLFPFHFHLTYSCVSSVSLSFRFMRLCSVLHGITRRGVAMCHCGLRRSKLVCLFLFNLILDFSRAEFFFFFFFIFGFFFRQVFVLVSFFHFSPSVLCASTNVISFIPVCQTRCV